MSWTTILAPMSGDAEDAEALQAAAEVASSFGARLTGVFLPPEVGPWPAFEFGDLSPAVLQALQEAAAAAEERCRTDFAALAYEPKALLMTGAGHGELGAAARLADVAVFTRAGASGPLAGAFRELLVVEGLPTLVLEPGWKTGGTVLVGWDGGRQAARAVRDAAPLLRKAEQVVVGTMGDTARKAAPEEVVAYLAEKGVEARPERLARSGEPAESLVEAAQALGATLLVAGAFGHHGLREFVFGGTTSRLLKETRLPLFLRH